MSRAASSPSQYSILATTYSTAKSLWSTGKQYKVVGTLESVAESLAKTGLKVADSVLKTGDLSDVDKLVTKIVGTADER